MSIEKEISKILDDKAKSRLESRFFAADEQTVVSDAKKTRQAKAAEF